MLFCYQKKLQIFNWDCIINIPIAKDVTMQDIMSFKCNLLDKEKFEFDYCIVNNQYAVRQEDFNKSFFIMLYV